MLDESDNANATFGGHSHLKIQLGAKNV